MNIVSQNPLSRHFRQPKLFVKLPSGGVFYPQGMLEATESGEFPIYSMTAKDELMFKTPDALLNGESTVRVIQSCIPNIKNAWIIPSIDIDAILIAIRLATYGEKMEITVNVPVINEERVYDIDLRTVLDQLQANTFENIIQLDGYSIEIHPLTYKEFTETALKTFDEQRLFKVINNDDLSELEKIAKFNKTFNRLTDLNISSIVKSVKCVMFDGELPVTNTEHIIEFFANAENQVFKTVLDHIAVQRDKFSIKPFKVSLPPEDIERGAPATLEVPISFDQSNFFA